LPNLEVGENAIVGAGAIVTKSVPANTVVAGNPGKVLRRIESEHAMDEDTAPIPFLDLVTPHRELEVELTEAFRHGLQTAGFVGGPVVSKFEDAFASFCDTQHSIAVSSGTDALRFAIMACGVQPGDVVVTVPNTFIATSEAISQARAIPEFVDIDEQTYNMSVVMLQRYLEKQCIRERSGRLVSLRSGRPVTAVVPVHLYGQMADMDGILELAERYGLIVIEDACQAHGAEYFSKKQNRWLRAGSVGKAAAFSFYPGKNLGACGEGGAVTTNDAAIAEKIKCVRDHGQIKKYYHDMEGYNGRLDAIQAAILHAKLPHVNGWNALRRERAEEYNRLMSNEEAVRIPFEPSWSRGVYHLYVVRTNHREELMEYLKGVGIGTGIHYPVPLHLQKAYVSLSYNQGDFPVTESVTPEILSLPMFPQLTAGQQGRVVREITSFVRANSRKPAEVVATTLA
jgi:dTDP-4-amino-4,6-dideoxygalactose transaminase